MREFLDTLLPYRCGSDALYVAEVCLVVTLSRDKSLTMTVENELTNRMNMK